MEIDKNKILKIKLSVAFLLATAFVIAVGFFLATYVEKSGVYPRGADIYGHLFRCDLMYENIKAGNYYPVYTEYWYNGFQPFRYSAPLSYYIVGGLQFITGNTMDAYILFIAVSFAGGAIGWILFGYRTNRILLCTVIGCLWFFIPDNARIFFSEGNLPRMASAIFLPYLFFFVWGYLENPRKKKLVAISILTGLITLCHIMVGALLGIATFVFLLIYAIANHSWRSSISILISMLLGLAAIGVWMYPALKGGIMQVDSSYIAGYMTQKATITLNPFLRLKGGWDIFYFGTSVLFIALIGVLISNRKCLPGFLMPILFFLGTTTAVLPLIIKLPLGELMWMMRFVPIVTAIFFLSLIEWKQCRRGVVIFFCILLILDSIPSWHFFDYSGIPMKSVEDYQKDLHNNYGLDMAKEITNQRVSFLGFGDATSSYPSYQFCSQNPRVRFAYGWNFQAATTGSNLVDLNTAIESGACTYMFDRNLELGNDTVIVPKKLLPKIDGIFVNLMKSADLLQYKLIDTTASSYLFHKNTPKCFGVITKYEGLTIGTSAKIISMVYPYFGKGKSDNINDYSYDELKDVKKLYLSGFTYTDKGKAEDLLNRLADHGVIIHIDMNKIPEDPKTKRMTFLGVEAQQITFETQFPQLNYQGKQVLPDFFKSEYRTWNTVFLENVPVEEGDAFLNRERLVYYGTSKNGNIHFMGFNLLYHAMETRDSAVFELLNELFGVDEDIVPKRELIPIKIRYDFNSITIESPRDNVNTTLAYLDIFHSKREMEAYNNLLLVDKGTTTITFSNPYQTKGIALSVIGIAGIVIFLLRLSVNEKKRRKEDICTMHSEIVGKYREELNEGEESDKIKEQKDEEHFLDKLDEYLTMDEFADEEGVHSND